MHHFHVHSNYSCRDGISKIDDILKKVKQYNTDAVAVTDHASIGGTLDFYDKCTAANIKPILGCEFYLRSEEKLTTNNQERMHLILLCKNLTGWKNLLKLVRQSYDDFYYNPLTTWDALRKYNDGLICSTACFAGPLAMPLIYDRYDLVEKHLHDLQEIFGDDLYVEFGPNGLTSQKKINVGLYNLCQQRGLKYIIGVDSHYIEQSQAKAQETMLGINFYSRITDKPKHSESVVEEKIEEKEEAPKPKKPRKKKGEQEESLVQTEEIVAEKKSKEKTRFAFERYDFWFMSEEELFKMWDENHKQVGSDMSDSGEAPHNLVLIKAIEYGKEIVSKIEKFNIYPDRNDLFMTYDVDSYKDEIFEKWMEKDKELKISENLKKSLKLMRYLANKSFVEKGIHKFPNYQEYIDRINTELTDMVTANIIDYMLIVWDMMNFCREQNINTGVARGCLIAETNVITDKGIKLLKDIEKGDKVVNRFGEYDEVIDTMSYNINNENLLQIQSYNSFEKMTLTKDHKVLSISRNITQQYQKVCNYNNKIKKYEDIFDYAPKWNEARNLKQGDLIFTPWIKNRVVKNFNDIDLTLFAENKQINNGYIINRIPLKNNLSQRYVHRATGLSRNCLRDIIKGDTKNNKQTLKVLSEYLTKHDLTIDEWKQQDNNEIQQISKILPFDNDFCFFLGLWIGDGWYISNPKRRTNFIGLAFNTDQDIYLINWTIAYLKKYGFKVSTRTSKNRKLIQIFVYGEILVNLLKHLFPNYKQTSESKSIDQFVYLEDEKLKFLLKGLLLSDGHTSKDSQKRECIDTTSRKLILEIKKCLMFLKIPSNIITRKPFLRGKYKCNTSYKIQFKGLFSDTHSLSHQNEFGYYSKIMQISEVSYDKVYDISIKNDPSYLTTEGIVHNSAAGSLIAYLLNIHSVDPIKYKLWWERFYNAGRIGVLPDIDTDVSTLNRHKVIEYLTQKYGSDKVAQICNYTFYRPKNTFKAVCRFYNLPFGEVNDLIRNIKDLNSKDDEDEVIEDEPTENQNGADDDDEEENKDDLNLDALHIQMRNLLNRKKVQKYLDMCAYKERIIDDCMAIVGCIANKSVHASGVVITSKPLVELCPVIKKPAKDKGSMDAVEQMTEWDMKMLDRAGFLKLDILGLNTVDIIAETIDSIKTNYGKFDYDWKKLSNDDPKVLKLFTTGETSGVFQFDYGKELQRLCLQFQPKTFEDICALTALGRPGAKNFLEQYMINRSKSEQEVVVADERLKPILKDTNYVLAYQEQQMAIAKDLCGFTLKEADNLRKIVAKKQVDKIADMKKKFLDGYWKNTVPKDFAGICDEDIELERKVNTNGEKIWNDYFSNCEYLFNKSHAVSYSVISYATAFFKAHYPIEFMTAVLNGNNNGKREDLVPYIYECMKMGLKINVPNYRTYKAITGNNGSEIFLGVNTIKDISDTTAQSIHIEHSRNENFLYKIFNLPKSQYEAVILSGFIDGYNGLNRRTILETCRYFHKLKEDWSKYDKDMLAYEIKVDNAKSKGKTTAAKMPIQPQEGRPSISSYKIIQVDDFTAEEKIAQEKEYLGYSYSDPDFKYMPKILTQTVYNYRQKKTLKADQEVYIYGKVDEIKTKKDKNDNEMASIKVLTNGSIWPMYLTTFSSVWEKLKVKPTEGQRYIFKCKVSEYISTKTKQLNKGFNMNDYRKPEEVWE